jgi:hypothetical protein
MDQWASSCEDNNTLSGNMESGVFIDELSDYQLLEKGSTA